MYAGGCGAIRRGPLLKMSTEYCIQRSSLPLLAQTNPPCSAVSLR